MDAVTQDKSDFTVLGQIDVDGSTRSPVTILELTETSCRVQEALLEIDKPAALEVWLGAIGPLRGHLNPASRDRIEFDGAIHSSIIEHFRS